MKKVMIFVWWSFLMICIPSLTLGWGVATHAYFAKELGVKYRIQNIEEIVYGSMLPDMFNLTFGSDYKDYLWNQTHYNFMEVMDKAEGMQLKAFAYGFTSHNDDWGADYTAHHDGRTTPGKGYVITKVELLQPEFLPMLKGILVDAKVPEAVANLIAAGLAPTLTENFVETAIDLMIKRNEYPEVGTMMLLTGQLPDFGQPSLLKTAYLSDFAKEFNLAYDEAGRIITVAEEEYRELMKFYGTIFTKEESEAIDLLAIYAATLGEDAIKALTGYDITLSPEVLTDFLRDYAIPSVEEDYSTEVSATLDYLEEQFLPMGIKEEKSYMTVCLYSQNYPNPFNPTTTIEFTLPETGFVDFVTYNLTGQKVRELVSGTMSEGVHSVVWDGRDDSGLRVSAGVYLTRLKMGNVVKTGRMMLVK